MSVTTVWLLYTPAIELLGRAIQLGRRATPPLDDRRIAAAVERFRLARPA